MQRDEDSTDKTMLSDLSGGQTTSFEPPTDPFWQAANSISDRLVILEKLGQGGMSAVYKAKHSIMQKLVAVKLLLPHLTSNPNIMKRFRLEAQATAGLDHANIVKVHDCGVSSGGHPYIIMDFIEGFTLDQILRVDGTLSAERAVGIFAQMTDALAHAHERGVVHRDLKPSNLMLVQNAKNEDVVKIVDFGIAKMLFGDDNEVNQALTQTGEIFGSPLYMSPEQCTGGHVDHRTDIYSTGCLMYEMLTGTPPFSGKNVLETMQAHSNATPALFVEEGGKDTLPKRLQAIIFKCLAKEPSVRYQSMKDLTADLKHSIVDDKGAWKSRGKDAEKLVHKATLKARVLKSVLVAGVLIALTIPTYSFLSTMNTPSVFEQKPVWQIKTFEPVKPIPNYDLEEHKALVDATAMESSHDRFEALNSKLSLADFFFANGKWTKALAGYKNYLDDIGEGEGRRREPAILVNMGECAWRTGEVKQAESYWLRSYDLLWKTGTAFSTKTNNSVRSILVRLGYHVRPTLRDLAYFYEMSNDENGLRKAAHYYDYLFKTYAPQRNDKAMSADFMPGMDDYALDLVCMADNMRRLKDPNALTLYAEVKQIQQHITDPDYASKLPFCMGMIQLNKDNSSQAVQLFRESRDAELQNIDKLEDSLKNDTFEGSRLAVKERLDNSKKLLKGISQELVRALWLDGHQLEAGALRLELMSKQQI